MIGTEFIGAVAEIAFLMGCIAFHVRLRTWASIALLLSAVACAVWAWLDLQIPYWNLGPSPVPDSLLVGLSNAAPYVGPFVYFSFSISFLATALSVPRHKQDPAAGA
jgi:hypothetical protein